MQLVRLSLCVQEKTICALAITAFFNVVKWLVSAQWSVCICWRYNFSKCCLSLWIHRITVMFWKNYRYLQTDWRRQTIHVLSAARTVAQCYLLRFSHKRQLQQHQRKIFAARVVIYRGEKCCGNLDIGRTFARLGWKTRCLCLVKSCFFVAVIFFTSDFGISDPSSRWHWKPPNVVVELSGRKEISFANLSTICDRKIPKFY